MYPQDLRENWHAGQGSWKDVPAAEWNDWHWQLRNRITTLAQLEERLTLTKEERASAFDYQEMLRLGLVQDIEIWANKEFCVNPLAVPADGPYGKLRTWYRQFFNDRARAAEIQQRVNGFVVTLDDGEGPPLPAQTRAELSPA